MTVNEQGCIIHRAMAFESAKHGESLFRCGDCGTEIIEYDDCFGG